MTERYAKAPITEAVIELRTEGPVPLEQLRKAEARIRKRYGKSEKLTEFKVTVGDPPQHSLSPAGFKLTSADGSFIVQTRTSALSLSSLAPYPGWSAFTRELEEIWAIWTKAVGRRRLSRIGTRFLNRLDVPFGPDKRLDSDDYLNVGVRLPPCTNNGADGGWQAVSVSLLPDTPFKLRLGCGTAAPAIIGHASFALDIDVFCDVDVPQTDADIWALLAQAKAAKNLVFDECITDKTRALIA